MESRKENRYVHTTQTLRRDSTHHRIRPLPALIGLAHSPLSFPTVSSGNGRDT